MIAAVEVCNKLALRRTWLQRSGEREKASTRASDTSLSAASFTGTPTWEGTQCKHISYPLCFGSVAAERTRVMMEDPYESLTSC